MYLYTVTDSSTMKRHWHFGGDKCSDCLYRFECFTDDRVHVKPVKVDCSEIYSPYWYRERYKAEFHLPKCLRLGLYKQISDTGYWSSSYDGNNFGDGFKLGAILKDDENGITLERSWVKFPNILYVTGTIR